jgi:hypothetical protein
MPGNFSVTISNGSPCAATGLTADEVDFVELKPKLPKSIDAYYRHFEPHTAWFEVGPGDAASLRIRYLCNGDPNAYWKILIIRSAEGEWTWDWRGGTRGVDTSLSFLGVLEGQENLNVVLR